MHAQRLNFCSLLLNLAFSLTDHGQMWTEDCHSCRRDQVMGQSLHHQAPLTGEWWITTRSVHMHAENCSGAHLSGTVSSGKYTILGTVLRCASSPELCRKGKFLTSLQTFKFNNKTYIMFMVFHKNCFALIIFQTLLYVCLNRYYVFIEYELSKNDRIFFLRQWRQNLKLKQHI